VCRKIAKEPGSAYDLTIKWNSVAVASDGSRVLGLGNIGPLAGLPVMEGKAILFKSYANIDAFPLCLSCQSLDELVSTIAAISPAFGGINLEDIESPKCFELERRLQEKLDIPVFHDDQHGTAVVVLAGLLNALSLVGKKKEKAKVVIAGAGAAGYATALLLSKEGFKDILVCDSKGIIADDSSLPAYKRQLGKLNLSGMRGTLSDALAGADAFIGLSAPNIIGEKDVRLMAENPVIFALSNPVPEIDPKKAYGAGAAVVGTARADLPNQINNVLGFPGIFRGALLVRSKVINDEMKLAAAHAIAQAIPKEELSFRKIVPAPFDRRVVPAVALAVAKAAMESGAARLKRSSSELKEELQSLGLLEGGNFLSQEDDFHTVSK
jgi:malate dehydrogenase (oxaloacetate-decarboxylating)